jgi:hypothetical protein
LRNGYDRPIGNDTNSVLLDKGEAVTFSFEGMKRINGVRIIFDSDLERPEKNMPCAYPLEMKGYETPKTLVRDFKMIFCTPEGEKEITVTDNYQRLHVTEVDLMADNVKIIPLETYGAEKCNIFSIDIL